MSVEDEIRRAKEAVRAGMQMEEQQRQAREQMKKALSDNGFYGSEPPVVKPQQSYRL